MKRIVVKNTCDISIGGKPSDRIENSDSVKKVAVLPSSIPHIKPKLVVKEGDKVSIGSPLFYDKKDARIQFLSPGAGEISRIQYGPRRVVDEVVISLSEKEQYEKLIAIEESKLAKTSRVELVEALLNNGVWPFLKSYPFKTLANPDETPPSIYVSIDNDEPYLPQSNIFMKDKFDDFRYGIEILNKLSSNVYIGIAQSNEEVREVLKDLPLHIMEGDYPANDPAIHLYYNKTSSKENNSWGIKAHDLLLLVESLRTGKYPTQRTVVLAGTSVKNRAHFNVRMGAPFSSLLEKEFLNEDVRYVAGGVLTGRKATKDSYFGFYETALHVLPDGKAPELLSFFRLGFDKPSYSRTYLSSLKVVKDWTMNTCLNGGYRSCIACNQCTQVCPVELQPQLVMRSLLADDVEDAIQQGFLDCSDCGLCTYVCPSKIELDSISKSAKDKLVKELAS